METSWDKLRAVLFALGIHAFAAAVLFAYLLWPHDPALADAEGPMIQATLVNSPQQAASVARAIQSAQQKSARKTVQQEDTTPPPQPKPEPKPQDAPQPAQPVPQAVIPKPDKVDQEEVRRVAELAAEQKLQEQEARHKQAQIDLSRQHEQQDAENRQRLAQQQLEQQQKLAETRKQLAAAAREVKLKEQGMKQLQDQAARLAQNTPSATSVPVPAHPPSGNAGRGKDLQADYLKAIKETVHQNWQTGNAPPHVICKAHVKQIPGGQVLDVTFPDCPFDAAGRQSVQDAFERTPLPYAGYDSVFLREFTIDLCYPEDPCK